MQDDFLSILNEERARLGKNPLHANENLRIAAQYHSDDMFINNYFSHTSLNGNAFSTRIKSSGYNYIAIGENIAYHSGSPDILKVFMMWKNSPGHYNNMISNSFNEAGLGAIYNEGKTFYVLDLGKRFSNINNTKTIPLYPNVIKNLSKPSTQIISSPSTDFKIIGYNKTNYRRVRIKANLNERSSAYYNFQNKTKRICNICSRFYLTFKIKTEDPSLLNIKIQNSAGQNNYSFYL